MLNENGQSEGIGGEVPRLNHPEKNLTRYQALSEAIRSGLIRTAHDCSEGGLAVAIAEMCIGGRLGALVDIDGIGSGSIYGRLWGESLGRIIIGVSPHQEEQFFDIMEGHELHLLGLVVENNLSIVDGIDDLIEGEVEEMATVWKEALDMTGGVA
jgi:phosphoribosylformylglycinamidine (FGAM) synthase-like enzyme